MDYEVEVQDLETDQRKYVQVVYNSTRRTLWTTVVETEDTGQHHKDGVTRRTSSSGAASSGLSWIKDS